MNYIRQNRKVLLGMALPTAAYHLYFLYLLPGRDYRFLWYLDTLLAVGFLVFAIPDYLKFQKKRKEKEELLLTDRLICQEYPDEEGRKAAKHDTAVLTKQIREQYTDYCELQDYITKWCHEVKLPLAAALLMTQKLEDISCREELREQLERISQQLNAVLLGCKVQGSLFDIKIKPVNLMECVRASIHNNQFFLIHSHFRMELAVEDIIVYTDPEWLVYVLDQLINNAVKYALQNPVLKMESHKEKNAVLLIVEDHGEGIRDCDLNRIFEKGYTGSNHHNGQHKSTGMGLYMADRILKQLGHAIRAESSFGSFTRFVIEFRDDTEWATLQKM